MKRLACALFVLTSGAVAAREAPSVPVPASWSLAGDWRAHDGNDAAFMGQQGPVRDWRIAGARELVHGGLGSSGRALVSP